jgi:tetratricopeptide (TPR) repeat protein
MIALLLIVAYPEFDSLIMQGIHDSYEEHYVEAEKKFRRAIELEPGDPAPYLFLTALYGLYMADFSTDTIVEKFYAYSDTTVFTAMKKIEEGDSSAQVHLWLAGGYGARAFYKVWNKQIVSGISDGIKSIKEFYATLEKDSTVYDAYIGVGCYDYFKHRLLSYVPWAENSEWEDEIELASGKGRYLRISAAAGHALLLVEDERYGEALKVASELVEDFPNTRTFRWITAKSYSGMEAWGLAKKEYHMLLAMTLSGQPDNPYNISYCRVGLARAHLGLGENLECEAECRKVLDVPDIPKMEELKEEVREILKKVDTQAN